MSLSKLQILSLDPFPSVLVPVYQHWMAEGARVEVAGTLGSVELYIQQEKYSAVFLPLLCPAPDVGRVVVGMHVEQSVVAANPNYEGRFLYSSRPESRDWARENRWLPDDRELVLLEHGISEAELIRRAQTALEKTLIRAAELRKEQRRDLRTRG